MLGDIGGDEFKPLVVRLRPAQVVVRADQHHGDVELALFDLGDLERALGRACGGRGGFGGRGGLGSCGGRGGWRLAQRLALAQLSPQARRAQRLAQVRRAQRLARRGSLRRRRRLVAEAGR